MIQNAGARGFSLVLLVCLLCLAAAPASAALIVGLPPDGASGNCVPFGCGYNGVYQQVYTHGLFATGPIIITGLDFASSPRCTPEASRAGQSAASLRHLDLLSFYEYRRLEHALNQRCLKPGFGQHPGIQRQPGSILVIREHAFDHAEYAVYI